jgi:Ser/Thr protein kinase RdoA (MazF antagonist)
VEQRIKERFNDGILQEAMEPYGIIPEQIHLLDGFESFMYEFERGDAAYILRIGHSLRRSQALIRGEVDWINYLAAGGASVARAIPSERGRWVEIVDDQRGGHFLATAFVKAEGRMPDKADWTPSLYESYGRLLGRMHMLAKDYEPNNPAWRRPEWDAPEMLEVERLLPPSEGAALARYLTLKEHLDTLPRDDTESYGMIHQDAHGGNLFVDDAGRITLFDFDDCTYSWFANDIAIVLFYAAMWAKDPAAYTREFMTHFLRGYRQENRLDAAWLKEIPHFLTLREIDLYAVIHRSFDVEHLDDPWVAGFMRGRRQRINDGEPYIDLNFESLAVHL